MSSGQRVRLARLGRAWSKSRVVAQLRACARSSPPLSLRDIRTKRQSLYQAARAYFGSLDKAFSAAGIDDAPLRMLTRWSKQLVTSKILERRERRLPLNPNSLEGARDNELLRQARKRFGSWAAALEAAGLESTAVYRRRRWTREGILAAIRRRAQEGKPLKSTCVQADDPPLYAAAQARLGGWRKAVAAAGLAYTVEPTPLKWTPHEILRVIRERDRRRRSLKASDIQRTIPGLYAAAVRRHGSWSAACGAAGVRLVVVKRPDWTIATLTDALAAFARRHEGLPISSLRSKDSSLLSAVYTRLGSIAEARRRVARHLGGRPHASAPAIDLP